MKDDVIYIDLMEYIKAARGITLEGIYEESLVLRIPRIDPWKEMELMIPAVGDE